MTSKPIPNFVVSVPYTGTRFLKARFGGLSHVHTYTNWWDLLKACEGKILVAPLRDPSLVWASWCRRRIGGNNKDPLKVLGDFLHAWFKLHLLHERFEIQYVCVDKKHDPRIKDWRPVGAGEFAGSPPGYHQVDLRPIYDMPFIQTRYKIE